MRYIYLFSNFLDKSINENNTLVGMKCFSQVIFIRDVLNLTLYMLNARMHTYSQLMRNYVTNRDLNKIAKYIYSEETCLKRTCLGLKILFGFGRCSVLSGSQRTLYDMTVLTNMFGLYRFSVYTGFNLVRFHCIDLSVISSVVIGYWYALSHNFLKFSFDKYYEI